MKILTKGASKDEKLLEFRNKSNSKGGTLIEKMDMDGDNSDDMEFDTNERSSSFYDEKKIRSNTIKQVH
jgi:hypothetical protein